MFRGLFTCERRYRKPAVVVGEILVSPNNPSKESLYDTVSWEGGASEGGEKGRFGSIETLKMLDTSSEAAFDRITNMMTDVFKTPVSLITLVAEPERVWFKSCVGPFGSCVSRDGSWCNYVLVPPTPEILITEDASKDARFAHNPYVAGEPFIKFYAGAPLVGSRGERYGTLCIVDLVQRSFTAELYSLLINFAALAVEEIERNKPLFDVTKALKVNDVERNRHLDMSMAAFRDGAVMVDARSEGWPIKYANPAFESASGLTMDDVKDKDFWDMFESPGKTRNDLGSLTGTGDQFETRVYCKKSSRWLVFRLIPATSDRLAPSKATGIPSWVPSEDAPKGTKLGLDVDKDKIVDIENRDTAQVMDTKCFWFAIIIPVADHQSTTLSTMTSSDAGSGDRGSSKTTSKISSHNSANQSGSSTRSGFNSPFGEFILPETLGECGKLKLGPLLGSGAFGRVYRSTTAEDCKAVAVKVVDSRGKRNTIDAAQLAEVELSCTLDHPNIVKVYAHGLSVETDGKESRQILWIVQELCNMGTWTNAAECGWFRTERKIDAGPDMKVILHALRDITGGMIYLHERKIIHADLSGNNILLDSIDEFPTFRCKVSDFGKARLFNDGEENVLDKLGTITHAPPELMADNLLFLEADVWSFGVLAWESVYGKRPYCGRIVPQIVLAVCSGSKLPWPEDLPAGFTELMDKVMSFDYEDRPPYTQVRTEVEAILNALP